MQWKQIEEGGISHLSKKLLIIGKLKSLFFNCPRLLDKNVRLILKGTFSQKRRRRKKGGKS